MKTINKYLMVRNYDNQAWDSADFGECSLIPLDRGSVQAMTRLVANFKEAFANKIIDEDVPDKVTYWRWMHEVTSWEYGPNKAWNLLCERCNEQEDQSLVVHINAKRLASEVDAFAIPRPRIDAAWVHVYRDGEISFGASEKYTGVELVTPAIHINTLRELAGMGIIPALDA